MPDWGPDIRARLSSVRLSPARESEIVDELSQHLEDRWRELVAGGADPQTAVDLARAEFQGTDVLARCLAPLRQARWADPVPPPGRWFLSGVLWDLRDALRTLRGTPSFTVAALVVLTLGIGASTAIFSVVDAVVLRGLPFDDGSRIVAIGGRSMPAKQGAPSPGRMPPSMTDPGDPEALIRSAPQNYFDWAAQQTVFESMAAIADLGDFTLRTGAGAEDVTVHRVTASFFDVLRIRPSLGRTFTADHEVEGSHRVAVLTDGFWRRRFAANPSIVGQTIALDDGAYEVIGVMGPGVTYPVGALRPAEIWLPYAAAPSERIRGRGIGLYLQSIARLKPGVTLEQARAQMDQIAVALEQANPQWNRGHRVGVRPLQDHLVGASMKSWMLMLLAAVALVLLIACANVANLLLARASMREREVAVRAALGASRWRLVRQFIVESLVLSVVGTALSIVLAWWALEVLRNAMPEGVPRVTTIALNARVLAATAGLALLTGVAFGILPALQVSRPGLTTPLKEGSQGAGASRGRQRLRSALVVAELAIAVVLLVGAALFIGSFIRLTSVDPGFDPRNVITTQLFQQPVAGRPPLDWIEEMSQIVERLNGTHGVVHAAAVDPGIPLSVRMRINGLTVPGRTVEDSSISIKNVTARYHQALGIPLKAGRLFTDADRTGSADVVILNEAAARVFFPGEDPIGRTVVLDRRERTVAGVVGDVRQWSLETAARTEVYAPMAQGRTGTGFLVVRTAGSPTDVLPAIRAAVAEALPGVPIRYVATMEELIARQSAQRRLNMLMLGLFGLLGLVIAAVGIFGLMAYIVSQRTREIGVRMALGASRSTVISMILTNVGVLVGAGLLIGGIGAWYLSATAQKFLFGLQAHDPRAYVVAMLALSVAALAASVIPAKRAASVDPIVALRAE